ncbi:hypothetical protein AMECASPLE_039302 [Ameca splendens]|uniref:Uncharacterized protein n=1 Tax=Ameca splendens TaxID=208324 RepID=A0ABV0YJH8_9TELE
MRQLNRERRQRIQQHPHNVKIAANTAKEIITDDTKILYFPNTSSQESHIAVSTPECSFISPFRDLKPSMAFVRLPSASTSVVRYECATFFSKNSTNSSFFS